LQPLEGFFSDQADVIDAAAGRAEKPGRDGDRRRIHVTVIAAA
jgi:hypothetical protein